jgi:hypothetical protein
MIQKRDLRARGAFIREERKLKRAMNLISSDPTILALRRALDRHYATAKARKDTSGDLISVIFSCLPRDIFNTVFLPTDGTRGPHLAITFKPAFGAYVTFAAEYWASLIHEVGSSSCASA